MLFHSAFLVAKRVPFQTRAQCIVAGKASTKNLVEKQRLNGIASNLEQPYQKGYPFRELANCNGEFVMSFFSGFMLGQAMSGRNNSGGLAVGLFGIIAFAFILLMIWATVGSFFLPLYSILHFALWGYEFGNEMMSLLAVIAMVLIVPASYAMALLGTRREFYVGAAILGAITFAVMYSLILFEGTPLHEIKELYEGGEHLTNTFIATVLCVVSVIGVRLFLCAICPKIAAAEMSAERLRHYAGLRSQE